MNNSFKSEQSANVYFLISFSIAILGLKMLCHTIGSIFVYIIININVINTFYCRGHIVSSIKKIEFGENVKL